MKVSSKYTIKFPFGQTIVMTLKSIHFAVASHTVKYVFVDDSGTIVKLTRGVCKRVVIKEYFQNEINDDELYG
jgi:hypothetical protein